MLIQAAPILKGSFSIFSFFNSWTLVPGENWRCAQYLVAKWPTQNVCTGFPSLAHLIMSRRTRQLEDGFHSYIIFFSKSIYIYIYFLLLSGLGKEIVYIAKSPASGWRTSGQWEPHCKTMAVCDKEKQNLSTDSVSFCYPQCLDLAWFQAGKTRS